MAQVPAEFHDMFDMKSFAHLSTVMPDGTPQVTPVWVDYDTEANRVLVNTARGRRKERNVRRDPSVGLSVTDPDDPYRYLSVRGVVDDLTEEGAVEHIDDLANRYMGVDEYPHHGGDEGARVILEIRPDHVTHS